jgi:hypothetical protein
MNFKLHTQDITKTLFLLGDTRFPEVRHFRWEVRRLRPIVLLLAIALGMKLFKIVHSCSETDTQNRSGENLSHNQFVRQKYHTNSTELARPVSNHPSHGTPILNTPLALLFPTAGLIKEPQRHCKVQSVALPIRMVARDFKANCKYCA